MKVGWMILEKESWLLSLITRSLTKASVLDEWTSLNNQLANLSPESLTAPLIKRVRNLKESSPKSAV